MADDMGAKPTMFGRGHVLGGDGGDRSRVPQSTHSVIVKRRWRLGDIIMCEPACRELAARGASVIFCTMTEYHAVAQCFHPPSPRVMSYPPPGGVDIKLADEEIDLDVVTLEHRGHVSKVDAFISAAGIDPEQLASDHKVPIIVPHPRHEAWARMRLSSMGILDEPLVGIARAPYEAGSARSLPDHVVDGIGDRFSGDHQVLYIGAMPTRVEPRDGVHNMTGITPDVMSAAALMQHLRVLVTVDTGLMHLAGAIGVPMVTVMGPTRPDDLATIYPRNTVLDVGRECSPCYDRGCENRCMDGVAIDTIVDLARSRAEHQDTPTVVHR